LDRGGLRRGFRSRDRQSLEGGGGNSAVMRPPPRHVPFVL
jgi:hypothetical protein